MVNVHIQGCCLDNGKPTARAGFGVLWVEQIGLENASEPLSELRNTNMNADLQAAIYAVEQATGLFPRPSILEIHTKTEMLTKAMNKEGWNGVNITTWKDGKDGKWKRKNGESVKNQYQYEKLLDALGRFIDYETHGTHIKTQEQREKFMKSLWDTSKVSWVRSKFCYCEILSIKCDD